MRYAIIADIHANLAALTAVLDDIEHQGETDEVWCLGDIIGYGPEPHQCIKRLRQLNHAAVAGNHDLAAIGKISTRNFNSEAAAACHWTATQLTPEDVDYLGSLPLMIQKGDFTLAHGSPREPVWEYLLSISAAEENFACFPSQFCLVGHSHVSLVFEYNESHACSLREFPVDSEITLAKNRLIINPGGLGQPRDGDPRASYAIYDSEARTIRHHRTPYNIEATQVRMLEYGLPERLATRLSFGV